MEGLGRGENEKSCGQRRGRNPVRLQGLSRGSNFGSNEKPAEGLQKCPTGRFGGAGREARRSGEEGELGLGSSCSVGGELCTWVMFYR